MRWKLGRVVTYAVLLLGLYVLFGYAGLFIGLLVYFMEG